MSIARQLLISANGLYSGRDESVRCRARLAFGSSGPSQVFSHASEDTDGVAPFLRGDTAAGFVSQFTLREMKRGQHGSSVR